MPRVITSDTFRELVLGLPEVIEGAHMGHADFRAGGRIFAGLTADELRATLRLPPAEQAETIAGAPDAFTPAAGAWGRQGWTVMELASVDAATARSAITLAWEYSTANPARPRRRATSREQKPRRR